MKNWWSCNSGGWPSGSEVLHRLCNDQKTMRPIQCKSNSFMRQYYQREVNKPLFSWSLVFCLYYFHKYFLCSPNLDWATFIQFEFGLEYLLAFTNNGYIERGNQEVFYRILWPLWIKTTVKEFRMFFIMTIYTYVYKIRDDTWMTCFVMTNVNWSVLIFCVLVRTYVRILVSLQNYDTNLLLYNTRSNR